MIESQCYQQSLDVGAEFHKKYPAKWAGDSTVHYKEEIKKYVERHYARSLLDYGCGKGWHYQKNIVGNLYGTENNPMSFDEYLGIKQIFKFDPCVPEYNILPPKDQKFDAVILIQSLPFVPDDDIHWVKNLLMSYTGKFCFIGNGNPTKPIKPRKQEVLKKDYFKIERTKAWYYNQFKDWHGSELIFYWID